MPDESQNVEPKPEIDDDVVLKIMLLITTGETIDTTMMPEELRLRVRRLLARTAGIKEPPMPDGENEVIPEPKESLMNILEYRFRDHHERHRDIWWPDVKKSLAAHPEKLMVLKKMEEDGGEPDILMVNGGPFVFCDYSREIPRGRRGVGYRKAVDRASALGAELMDEYQYRLLHEQGVFDRFCSCWLKTSEDMLADGEALQGDGKREANIRRIRLGNDRGWGDHDGWRAVVRVPKVN